jgi:pyruvate ferredoxin oxidoreductase beta subunit
MLTSERINYFAPGHRACPGCGAAVAVRQILRAAGKDTIVVSATGCLETFSSPYGQSAWEVPWVHSLFENSAAVANGVEAALEVLGEKSHVIVISGDGGTYDIGLGILSGMFERKVNVTYICYNNEAYMNTGVQRSSATPLGATTTTTPLGKFSYGKTEVKKDLPAIAAAHGVEYIATATIAYPQDLMKKVAKAISITGSKYIEVFCPCCIGWGFDSSKTVQVARMAVETGLYPIYEWEKGQIVSVRKVPNKKPIEEYLQIQNRFKHFLQKEQLEITAKLKRICEANIKRYDI